MKLFPLLFILISVSIFGQYTESKGQIGFKYSRGIVDSANYNNFSIGGEWLVTKRIGLNYNFDVILRNDRIYQLHSSAGIILGPPLIGLGIISWIASPDLDGNGKKDANFGALGIIGGILLLALPEGISYHFPIGYNWDVAPYANILGVDWMKNNNIPKSYFRYAASFGTKVTFWNPNKMTVSGFIETRKVSGMGWAFGGGLGLGYTIGKKLD